MTGYGYRPQPEIIWIKDSSQLDQPYKYDSGIKFVFAKYEIVDKTHDKIVKRTASIKKAEEKKARHLAYKKHAKCDVQIVENDLQSKLDLTLSNVYGINASYEAQRKVMERKYETDYQYVPLTRDFILVDRNINMVLKINKVELDKFIITKAGKEMRLTILKVEDRNNVQTTITLFDNDVADKISENQFIKITNAEVNMRKYLDQFGRQDREPVPEGLKIPSWAKLELIDLKGFPTPTQAPIPISQQVDVVRCEQVNCSGQGQDTQYYCTKCDMELCSICIFEHRKDTSISGLECDMEICYGSRKQNTMEVVKN